MQLTDTEAAYIAGIVDGEGCIALGYYRTGPDRAKRYVPRMTVCNTDEPVIDYLVSTTDARKWTHSRRSAGGRTIYRAEWRAIKMRLLLPQLEPYLIVKRDQARVMIDYLAQFGRRGPVSVSDEELEHKRETYLLMRELKAA